MATKTQSLAHTKWLCKYHIVFTPKYRRKVIYNQYRNSLREILRRLCEYKGVKIIEGELMADHVHMLVLIPPKISVSSFMGYLKGKSALMMFDKHANLKYKFGNRHFWSEGYYVSTVGLNEATVKKYIQVTERMDEESTYERELYPLRAVRDNHEKIVIQRYGASGLTDDGIKIINLCDFLLLEE